MSPILNLSRREFLRASGLAGGGLILGFYFAPVGSRGRAGAAQAHAGPFVPNAFIRISPDDTVTLIINKSEMGQGVYTSLPMLIAEELECDWNKIHLEPAPVAPAYNHTEWGAMQGTGGSSSVRSEWERLRLAGASAREMLIAAAAATWRVDPGSCRAQKSKVIHPDGKTLTFGELALKAADLPVPKKVTLKDPAKFKLIGRSTKRLDTPEKTDGKALFGLDAQVPGMLVALIARPPVFGGKVKSLDAEKTRAFPGVREVFQIPSGVAVVADSFWPAKKGRDLLQIVWDDGEGASLSTASMRKEYERLADTPGMVSRRDGDTAKAFRGAAQKFSAEYEVPYLAHAMMEPLNCLVDFRQDSCEIRTGTQFQTADRDAAARILGLKKNQVNIRTMLLGGGFGRRANPQSDFVSEAASVAKVLGKPVKVIWTREDDIKGGYYRPMWLDKITAALDAKGNPVAWQHTIVGQSILAGSPFEGMMVKNGVDATSVEGAADIPYDIPNILVDLHSPKNSVPVQWWRSVGHSHTAFVVESFIDELAHAAKADPCDYRLRLLAKNPRHKAVLTLAAEKAGWGTRLPSGRGRGIAVHEAFGSFIAQVAEVSVSKEGSVRVHRVVCTVDCGRVVNPDTVAAQMEGAIVFGLSAALYGAITLTDGRVDQSNFHNYQMLRMSGMPVVEVFIVPSTEGPEGVGEPGVPPIAPAVANAVFAVTGKRLRSLPIRADALKQG